MVPVEKYAGKTALVELLAGSPYNLLGYGIARKVGISKDKSRLRRNHERRIGYYQVEPLLNDRLVETARPAFDIVYCVKPRIEFGKIQCTRVGIGPDDLVGMTGGQKCLYARTTTEVKGGIDKAADVASDKTGGKYDEHIDKGADTAKDAVDGLDSE